MRPPPGLGHFIHNATNAHSYDFTNTTTTTTTRGRPVVPRGPGNKYTMSEMTGRLFVHACAQTLRVRGRMGPSISVAPLNLCHIVTQRPLLGQKRSNHHQRTRMTTVRVTDIANVVDGLALCLTNSHPSQVDAVRGNV